MIKAILFDCFGVLVEGTFEPFIDQYLQKDELKIERFHEIDKMASKGLITYDELVSEASKLADISEEETERFLNNHPANLELFDFIKTKLKPNYKIGFLSNASDNWMDELFTPEQLILFDDVVISFEHSLAKPDPEIFKLAANRLNVNIDECLFVDDVPSYCEGAIKAGMKAIRYANVDQFKKDIGKLISKSD